MMCHVSSLTSKSIFIGVACLVFQVFNFLGPIIYLPLLESSYFLPFISCQILLTGVLICGTVAN